MSERHAAVADAYKRACAAVADAINADAHADADALDVYAAAALVAYADALDACAVLATTNTTEITGATTK